LHCWPAASDLENCIVAQIDGNVLQLPVYYLPAILPVFSDDPAPLFTFKFDIIYLLTGGRISTTTLPTWYITRFHRISRDIAAWQFLCSFLNHKPFMLCERKVEDANSKWRPIAVTSEQRNFAPYSYQRLSHFHLLDDHFLQIPMA
jgi:hypothetical protein